MKTGLLQDKIIFLTGGSTGIGWKCAQAYAAEGAQVAIVARDTEAVAKAVADLGPDHFGFACDISIDAEVQVALAATLARYGKLDAVHNNAGIGNPLPSSETRSGPAPRR